MSAAPVRVVVADDHPLMLRGLHAVIAGSPSLELVATAGDGVDALEAARTHRPDVIVLDIDMPRLDGIGVARALRSELPSTRVLMLSLHADDEHLAAALAAGAHGYVAKGDDPDTLVRAVRAVASGDAVFGAAVASRALTRLRADAPLAVAAEQCARIRMFGPLSAEIAGREVVLPHTQGRVVLAYLVAHRDRPVARDELLDVLWPETAPADPDAALSVVLTRLRRALGDGVLRGREALEVDLGPAAQVDAEAVVADAEEAEARLASGDDRRALEAAQRALAAMGARYLTGLDGEWIEARRREMAQLRETMLHAVARAGVRVGGGHLAAAERAARMLLEEPGVDEPAFAALMRVHAARGDVGAVSETFAALRARCVEVLGTVPSRALIDLHDELVLGPAAA